jgi:hypothetical protein
MEKGHEDKANEFELQRMIAVVNGTFPKNYRLVLKYSAAQTSSPANSDQDSCKYMYLGFLGLERFDGVYWNNIKWLISTLDPVDTKEEAYRKLLGFWGRLERWKYLVADDSMSELIVPAASSLEELCFKLEFFAV